MQAINDKIISTIISSLTSLTVALITVKINLYIDRRKNKREELNKFIANNTNFFNELVKIGKCGKVDYRQLRESFDNNLYLYIALPKDLMNKFFCLYSLISLQGDKLNESRNKIRELSNSIINRINEIGVGISEFDK